MIYLLVYYASAEIASHIFIQAETDDHWGSAERGPDQIKYGGFFMSSAARGYIRTA